MVGSGIILERQGSSEAVHPGRSPDEGSAEFHAGRIDDQRHDVLETTGRIGQWSP
jgi:hypothetical protein